MENSVQREYAVYSGGRPSQRYTLSQPDFPYYFSSFLHYYPANIITIGGYTILSLRYTLSECSFYHFSTIISHCTFFCYSWDTMALVTKTGGFYRRTEKGIHFFCHLCNSVCFGRMIFCTRFVSFYPACFGFFVFVTIASQYFLFFAAPTPTITIILPLSLSYSPFLSCFLFVFFEMMGLAVGCFLFLLVLDR